MKLQEKEVLFTLDGECDKKNKLLRSNVKLTGEDVSKIDSGKLSIEDLNALVAKRAKIFKYRTQITIHANFPREVQNRVNGYSYLINNQNGSVGVKYGAIDENKRQYIDRFLQHEGFNYYKNSTEHDFNLTKRFSKKEEAVGYIEYLKGKYDYQAVTRLINGGFQILGGVYMWQYYVILKLVVNSIPKENIGSLLALLKCKSVAEIEEIERIREEERQEKRKEYQLQSQENEKLKKENDARKKEVLLKEMNEKYKRISSLPAGCFTICIVTDHAKLVVIKRFKLKNKTTVTKKFLQRDVFMPDFQKWNDTKPSHIAKDTCKINENEINRYLQEGCVFIK